MDFWNKMLLIGLAAVAIPILIHLLNRRRAQVIEWGAMRFLLGSVAARNRRIMLEEIILMVLRCLLVALAVLAVARPFLQKRSIIPWGLALPTALAAVVCAAIAGAAWHYRKARKYLLIATAVLLGLVGGATAAEYFTQGKLFPSDSSGRDIAIVIDGSLSMCLKQGTRTNAAPRSGDPLRGTSFDDALTEAAQVVSACNPSDTVSVFVAGSVPHELTTGPISDRKKLLELVRDAKPVGGSLGVLRALESAATSLREGHNSARRIVLLTDTQGVGWNCAGAESWKKFVAGLKDDPRLPGTGGGKGAGAPTDVVCRRLPMPSQITNAAIEQVALAGKLVGVGRPVKVSVTVRNFGTQPVPASSVRLRLEGKDAPLSDDVRDIPPGASRVVHFDCTFEKPGPHVVRASFMGDDDIREDNTSVRVVDVVERLPVLIVDGAPAAKLDDSATGFLSVALALREEVLTNPSAAAPARLPARSGGQVASIVEPRVVLPEQLSNEKDLGAYRAVILANVARLPEAPAKAIAEYVSKGGGLLILAGDRANGAFYNAWTLDGKWVSPAKLPETRVNEADPVPLSLKSFNHPAVRAIIDSGQSDAASVVVASYWKLGSFGVLRQAQDVTGLSDHGEDLPLRATLENGAALMAERRFNKGTVIMTAVGFDAHDSNLPRSRFFLPLAHELVCHLAEASALDWNVMPGMNVTLPQAAGLDKAVAEQIKVVRIARPPTDSGRGERVEPRDKAGNPGKPQSEETPDEVTLPVAVDLDPSGTKVAKLTFRRTDEPGLFRFLLPPQLAGVLAGTPAQDKGLPFVVEEDPAESDLTAQLKETDLALIHKYFADGGLKFREVENPEDLQAVLTGLPSREIWKYLALGALIILVGEIALARWIAVQRKAHSAVPVVFGTSPEARASFRARARQMVAVSPGQALGTPDAAPRRGASPPGTRREDRP